MIRLTISNQRGGVGKTTTAITLARSLADRGMRVLLIDADSQGSIAAVLGLKPSGFLADLMIRRLALRECMVAAHANVDVICGNRKGYDAVLIDVAPSISLFQTCAMVYTQQVLIPVDMDILSVQGATASIQAAEMLNGMLAGGVNVRIAGLLPVKVDRRLAITEVVLNTLTDISAKRHVALFSGIRTDQAVVKSGRYRQFLADFDPRSKALEDYEAVIERLLDRLTRREVIRIDEKSA